MEHNSTILIVDDNLAGRETLKGLLYGRGYNLAFASNGIEALEKAVHLTPDLILLDIMMPGMDGYEVCQRLRANPIVAEVPVIMVTALDDRDSRLRGIEAGADDFVSKPFDHAELRTRVQTITRLNRYRRLHSERTKFEWVVEQADDGYIIVDDQDNILYANSQARLYLNLSTADNILTQTFLGLAANQYHTEPQAAWVAWPKRPTVALPRYLVRPASNVANPFWLKVDIIDMNMGVNEEHLVRMRDVTSKVAEQRSVWTFHGQVSHKLRTPLNHLFAALDMIQESDLEQTDADIQTFFSIAKKGANRLKNEIQDIFQYLEASNIAASAGISGCSLSEIEVLVNEINSLLKLESIKVTYENIDSPQSTYGILSRRATELIMWELLENAKKFHPAQTPVIEVAVSLNHNHQLALKVGDDGLTLSPDQLERMWAPYYQAEKYFTGQVSGTGLGLSIVTSLIWGVGGTCTTYNRPNQPGIVVELVIPVQDQSQNNL